MFAKLVTAKSATVSANVFYNTLIGVITGTVTTSTQLDPTTFNQASSYIINIAPTNWTVNDPSANLAGMVAPLPGANMQVLFSPMSDDPTRGKYLLLSPVYSTNNVFNIATVPSEGYSNTTKSFSNSYHNAYNIATTNVYTNSEKSAGAAFNNLTSNNSTGNRFATDLVSYMSSQYTSNGIVAIVSASNTHLLVATYKSDTGLLQGGTATGFNNYFHISEYSRDDPWNTVGNGYPSWFFEGCSNNFGYTNTSITPGTNIATGALCRIINTGSGNDIKWVDMNTVGNFANGSDWGIVSRNIPYGAMTTVPLPSNYANFSYAFTNFIPRGLNSVGTSQLNIGNYITGRDSNRNPAAVVSELRLVGVHNGNGAPAYSGFSLTQNTMFAGGSISSVAPYLYSFKSQYNNFDEISFGGNTYMNIIVNNGLPGTTNASCILVREI